MWHNKYLMIWSVFRKRSPERPNLNKSLPRVSWRALQKDRQSFSGTTEMEAYAPWIMRDRSYILKHNEQREQTGVLNFNFNQNSHQ